MTEQEVKTIFMYCHNKNPNGLYPTEVDLIEFANKVEAYLNYRRIGMQEAILDCIEWYDATDKKPFPIDSLRQAVA